MVDVLVVGHLNWDITLRVDALPAPDGEAAIVAREEHAGGSAGNVAVGLAQLGVAVGVAGCVGTDTRGRQILEALAAAGVDTDAVQQHASLPTTQKHVLVDPAGEVMVLGAAGANAGFDPTALPAGWPQGLRRLHLTSQRAAQAATLAATATAAGVRVSVDPGRRIDADVTAATADATEVFLNDREAAVAVEVTPTTTRSVVVKHGPDGAELRRASDRITHPGFPAVATDTTGAGDAFAAGYLAAALRGDPPERRLAVANACGAAAAAAAGARPQLSWADIAGRLGG
jgi:ribokinase